MNRIYWDEDKVSMLTDQIDAVPHKHWALQLFLSVENDLELFVSGKRLKCKCAVVKGNAVHRFCTGNQVHFSMIIDPTSSIAQQLKSMMHGKDYYIVSFSDFFSIQSAFCELRQGNCFGAYDRLIHNLYQELGIVKREKMYDERVSELLHYIDCCDCASHSISLFAEKVSLSPSRLSHLFREQVGLPLKSYIQFHQMKKVFLALFDGKSITDAAMLANFDTPSHFAAVTKRMMGMPASISLKDSAFLKVNER